MFWRQSREDSVFTPPGIATFGPTTSRSRFIGTQAAFAMKYQANQHVELNAEYARIFAGPFITHAGGRDVDFFGYWSSFMF